MVSKNFIESMSWFQQTKPQTILHYVNTLKQELDGTRAYLETDTDEMKCLYLMLT